MSPTIDAQVEALVLLAAAMAAGEPRRIDARVHAALAADVPPHWIDELLLQSVLTVGWPRALVAAGICRHAVGPAAAPVLDTCGNEEWRRRGEATCRVIYGPSYEQLRSNVRALHPEFDDWLITEAYGRILSRPALELRVRELCTIAQTAVLDTPRQLHSHLLGALRAGAGVADIDRILELIAADLAAPGRDEVSRVWAGVRAAASR